MSRLEAAMYHYGLRARLPFDLVDGFANAGRIASEPGDYLQQRQAARACGNSPWAGFFLANGVTRSWVLIRFLVSGPLLKKRGN